MAIQQKVAFVLIAGDLYDSDWRDYNTGLFFVDQIRQLREANIPLYLISGNHDAANKMTRTLKMPENVTLFSADLPETAFIRDLDVAIHGQGFATAAVYDDLSEGYPLADASCLNIGVLHTCAAGGEGHERYAPCSVDGLKSKGYDYWALGHIHLREILSAAPFIGFSGNSVLQDTGRLFPKFRDADQLRIRLEGIDREAREFVADVKGLVGNTLPELAKESPEDAVSLLSSQLKEAQLGRETRNSLSRQIDELQEKLRQAQSVSGEATVALEEMCRSASCDSPDQLSHAAIQSRRRRELESTVRGLEESISGQSGGIEFEAFLQQVESEPLDFDLIQPRIDELDDQIDELNGVRDTVIGQMKEANIELAKIDGGSKASDLSLKYESVSSRLEERVQELASLRMAAAVLHAAIEQYREKNQGPVLTRASDIFARITMDAFSGLQADFDQNGEPVLTGVRKSSGEKIPVGVMSDSTCDQLYLALRLASFENWLTRHESMPFIVDDVLLNFDDDRAIAGLQVLTELSKQTQVIFFTHHQHLVDMATETLSKADLFVTTLNGR